MSEFDLVCGHLAASQETLPIDDSDLRCFSDLRDVLARHGKLERFGVSLLYSYFPMAADETLLETHDPATRSITVTVASEKDLNSRDIETCWRFTSGPTMIECLTRVSTTRPQQTRFGKNIGAVYCYVLNDGAEASR